MIDKNRGVDQLDSYSSLAPDWLNMSHRESENHFAETFSSLLESSLITTNAYGELLRNGGTAEQSLQRNFGHSSLSKQLKQIAKVTTIRNHPLVLRCDYYPELLTTPSLGSLHYLPLSAHVSQACCTAPLLFPARSSRSERDFFFTKFGNFDTHQNTNELDGMTAELDNGIKEFSDEMKAQGLWENVTIVTVSDFGRTLTGNGVCAKNSLRCYSTCVATLESVDFTKRNQCQHRESQMTRRVGQQQEWARTMHGLGTTRWPGAAWRVARSSVITLQIFDLVMARLKGHR